MLEYNILKSGGVQFPISGNTYHLNKLPSGEHTVEVLLHGSEDISGTVNLNDNSSITGFAQDAGDWAPTVEAELLTVGKLDANGSLSRPDDSDPMAGMSLVLRSLDDVEEQTVEWIWGRWLARRKFHLLAGYAGDGKSMMTASLVATLSKGGVLPDGSRCEPHRILLLLAEDDLEDAVKPRLRWHGANMANVFAIEAVKQEGGRCRAFSIVDHVEMLEPIIKDLNIDALVVDPISSFMQGSDRNSENVRDVLQPLKDLAARTRIAVLGIAHVGKSQALGRRPLERVLGATAFVAFSRIVWMLAPASQESDENERVLAVQKSNVSLKPSALGWRFTGEDEPIEWTGVAKEANITAAFNGGSTSDLTPERKRIVDYLKDAGPASPADVADKLGMNPNVVSKLLGKMKDAGNVTSPAYGKYDVPRPAASPTPPRSPSVLQASDEDRAQSSDEMEWKTADARKHVA